jgi:hypothetical protein
MQETQGIKTLQLLMLGDKMASESTKPQTILGIGPYVELLGFCRSPLFTEPLSLGCRSGDVAFTAFAYID